LRNFTDENILSVYTEGITVGKKLKQSKKNDDMSFLPTKFILSVNLLVSCEHCSSYQLQRNHRWNFSSVFFRELQNCSLSNCTVNCCSLQTKSPTDWKVNGVIRWFSEKKNSINLNFSFKYYRRNRRWIEKSSVIFWQILKTFLWNWKFKLNITDGITDGIIKKY
jgi:hypothetical protein